MLNPRSRVMVHAFALSYVIPFIDPIEPAGAAFDPSEGVVEAYCEGVPVKMYGRIFAIAAPPDFERNVILQEGNTSPPTKLALKSSSELNDNFIGVHHNNWPRSAKADYQPFLPIHLIDGDPATGWASMGAYVPDLKPEWIRLDLPIETNIREIVLLPREDGQGVPKELSVKVARDAWHWEEVFSTDHQTSTTEPIRIALDPPTAMKQAWIIADNFPLLGVSRAYPNGYDAAPGWRKGSKSEVAMHKIYLAEVQLIDESGENVALASRGTGVTVSSTFYGDTNEREPRDMFWTMQFEDLGNKWIRAGVWTGDSLAWDMVERDVKGRHVIDPRTDEAIRQAKENGVNVVVFLGYGNWLYMDTPRPNNARGAWYTPLDRSNPYKPITPAMLEGFKNYARFVARHFKGRVDYYELFNEPDAGGFTSPEYVDFVREVAPVIRAEDPQVKIACGGMGSTPRLYAAGGGPLEKAIWLEECIDLGLLDYVDALNWHGSSHDKAYQNAIRKTQKFAEERGFKGDYFNTEVYTYAPYPSFSGKVAEESPVQHGSEIGTAKYMARAFIANRGLGVIPFFVAPLNVSWGSGVGAFRLAFPTQPNCQYVPNASYYLLRNICTAMEGARPYEIEIEFSEKKIEFEGFGYHAPESHRALVAVYLTNLSSELIPGITTDVIIKNAKAEGIVGIDLLNGIKQDLEFRQDPVGLVIPNLQVRDYPLILSFQPK